MHSAQLTAFLYTKLSGDRRVVVTMEPPNQLDLTDEQRRQLMTYMEELEEQRTSDPTAFQKTMVSLGLQSPMSSSGLGNQGTKKAT
jgi:hypothetical protein